MTFADNLRRMKSDIELLLRNFIDRYTDINVVPSNHGNGFLRVGYSDWRPLKAGGKPVQTALLQKYRQFHSIIEAITMDQPSDDINELKNSHKTLIAVIEQIDTYSETSKDSILDNCTKALTQEIGLLAAFAPSPTDDAVLVPDTNALLFNPDLEKWTFDGQKTLLIVLLPVVLGELDKLKIEHRNEDVRKKAEGLIGRIKDYRRRGPLCDGVVLKKDVSRIMSVAKEPDLSKTLPWLDKNNADDRMLASFLEVVRQFPHSPVVLVTRDINLQNKAEFARLPFVEPPSV